MMGAVRFQRRRRIVLLADFGRAGQCLLQIMIECDALAAAEPMAGVKADNRIAAARLPASSPLDDALNRAYLSP